MVFFFFNDTATTEIYTLSLHDALPILAGEGDPGDRHADQMVRQLPRHARVGKVMGRSGAAAPGDAHDLHRLVEQDDETARSEEHTSELQSRQYLVCRLLLEKKNRLS